MTPTFSRLTHPFLPCAKQKNLADLPICNSLLSALSHNYASFIAALFEIDYFLLHFIHEGFTINLRV